MILGGRRARAVRRMTGIALGHRVAFERATQREAVHLRHHDVGHDAVGKLRARGLDSRRAVGGLEDAIRR